MSGLVLVVFPRSRLCLLHENDNRLLFEMATTVTDANDRFGKVKIATSSTPALTASE